MTRLPKIVPVTDLRQDAAGVLKRVRSSHDPLVITQRGRVAAILLSPDAYEKSLQEKEVLRLLARGEKEIARGKGFSLDSVLKDADSLLADDDA